MTGTPDESAATRWHLRPAVHAGPLVNGVHVRGLRSSFTVEGGPGLWRLWKALAAQLEQGCAFGQLGRLSSRPEVRQALRTLVEQLREHGMLVEVPTTWRSGSADRPPEQVARWLETVAPDPAAAWSRMTSSEVTVTGEQRVAKAAVLALTAAGLRARLQAATRDSAALLTVGGAAVAAASDGVAGFVTPVGTPEQASCAAKAIAERLGLSWSAPHSDETLSALVGGAAAHRLMCASLGLPDPDEASALDATQGLPGHPRVLVARSSPLRSEYRPWLGGGRAGAPPPPEAERPDLNMAVDRVNALCDPELGTVPAVEIDDLVQVPLGLARCRVGHAVVVGVGLTSDAARLAAALAAAEPLIPRAEGGFVVCGVDAVHAEGILLRRLVNQLVDSTDVARWQAVPDAHWRRDPVARRWWRTLTSRFGVAAEMTVRQLAPDVFHALVLSGSETLSWAVEATVGDAAAFAALAAAGKAQWAATGRSAPTVMNTPCGALPARPAGPQLVPWHSEQWAWPRRTTAHERTLQQRLSGLVKRPAVRSSTLDGPLARALSACGFVVVAGGSS